ncbi:endonuclease/exonuclease/phosphatase family protein [Saccharobesus litoralis]|nr:endonuclease/exonuclease/phosphatase family protein [Saccharobesus litoralis]
MKLYLVVFAVGLTLAWRAASHWPLPIWWLENLTSFQFFPLLLWLVVLCCILPWQRFCYSRTLFQHAVKPAWKLPAICLVFLVEALVNILPTQIVSDTALCHTKVNILQANWAYHFNAQRDVETLLASQADLIVLQEVSQASMAKLKNKITQDYPFSANLHANGQFLLSKTPLFSAQRLNQFLTTATWQLPNTQPVTLFTMHPPSPRSASLWHTRNTAFERLQAESDKALFAEQLVVGDFNLASTTGRYKKLSQGWHHLPVVTWPEFGLLKYWGVAIDHLWVSGSLKVVTRASQALFDSDHRAVMSSVCIDGTIAL